MKNRSLFSVLGLLSLVVLCLSLMTAGVTREIPTGILEGRVLLEDGRAFPEALVTVYRQANDGVLVRDQAATRTDKNGRFRISGLPDGSYSLGVSAKVHSLEKEAIVAVVANQTKSYEFKLKRAEPHLNAYASKRVFLPEDKPFLQVQGLLDAKNIRIRRIQLSTEELAQSGNLYSALAEVRVNMNSDQVKWSSELDDPIGPTDVEGSFSKTIELEKLPSGVHWLRVDSPDSKKKIAAQDLLIFVSEIGLLAKPDSEKISLYVSDLRTGQPVKGAQLRYFQQGSSPSEPFSTDEKGLGQVMQALPSGSTPAAVLAEFGKSVAICTFSRYREGGDGQISFVLDRPIYRPGDTVHFKAIVRKASEDGGYSLPSSASAEFVVTDADGEKISTVTGQRTSFGTYSGSFQLKSDDARSVNIETNVDGVDGYEFVSVAAYRKPQFKVSVTPLQPVVFRGDRAKVKVKCEYFFGGPVVGAKITGSVNDEVIWWSPSPEEAEMYGDESYTGDSEYMGEIAEAQTNDAGEVILEFDTQRLNWQGERSADRELVFEVSATENDEQYFDGKGSVKVVQAAVSLEAEPDRWVMSPEGEANIAVTVTDAQGRPAAATTIAVEEGQEVWQSGGAVFVSGRKYNVKTDSKGLVRLTSKAPREGDLSVNLSARDSRGRMTSTKVSVWVSGRWASFESSSDIKIATDQTQYDAGQTITATLRSGIKDAYAWVTLESDKVLEQKVIPIKNGNATVQFVAPKVDRPNVFLSVSVVRGQELVERIRSVRLSLKQKEVQIDIQPDRQTLMPGETVNYTIQTRDASGKPVPSEVSVGVVDESIYAIREDSQNLLEEFYPTRWSQIYTVYSFQQVYLDGGDKGEGKTAVRKDFRDTADWNPTVVTDSSGRGTWSVKLPDNITGWRATAVALTADTRFGKSRVSVQAKKPIMIRLEPGKPYRLFDQTRITAVVTNGTDKSFEGQASLSIPGVTQKEFSIKLAGNATQVISLDFSIQDVRDLKILGSVSGQGLQDAVEITAKVLPFGADQFLRTSAEVTSEEPFTPVLDLPTAFTGKTVLHVSNGRFGRALADLTSLLEYPYGCVEQVSSRMGPALAAGRLMKQAGQTDAEWIQKLDEIAERGISQLRGMQQANGSWGWVASDSQNPRMTGIALSAIHEAVVSGYVQADAPWLTRAQGASVNMLKEAKPKDSFEIADYCLLAGALLKYGNFPEARAMIRKVNPNLEKNDWLLANTAKALADSNDDSDQSLAAECIDRWLALQEMETKDRELSWYGRSQDAMILEAESVVRPKSSLEDELIRKLLEGRKERGWINTFESGKTIYALAKLAERDGIQTTPVSVEVTYGDGFSRTLSVAEHSMVEIPAVAKGGDLVVRVLGDGKAYCALETNLTTHEEDPKPQTQDDFEVTTSLHRLKPTRLADGRRALAPDTARVNEVQSGEVLVVRTRVTIHRDQDYVMLKVPIPSNAIVQEDNDYDEWSYWFTGREVFDHEVWFYVDKLNVGEHVFEFYVRAETPGTTGMVPTQVFPMYIPERRVLTPAQTLKVNPK